MKLILVAAIAFALGSGQAALSEEGRGSDGTDARTLAVRLRGTAVPPSTLSSESAELKPDSYIAHLEKERLIYRRGWRVEP